MNEYTAIVMSNGMCYPTRIFAARQKAPTLKQAEKHLKAGFNHPIKVVAIIVGHPLTYEVSGIGMINMTPIP